MRDTFLRKLAHWHAAYPWRMLGIVLFFTFVFAFFAAQLKVTMRWADLLPSGDKRTLQFNKIIDEFVSATSLVVVVQGEEIRIKRFADALAPRILEATVSDRGQAHHPRPERNLFLRVDYKTEIEFMKNHGLMLVKEEDLRNIKDVFLDPNFLDLITHLNNSMEKEYVGREESISTREKEDGAVMFLDGIQSLVLLLKNTIQTVSLSKSDVLAVADKILFGEPYLLSYDKKALILNVIPNFTMLDTDLLVEGTDAAQEIVDELLKSHPGVEAGLTGMIALGRDEMVYSEQSLGYTTLIAVAAILLLLVVSFRMWVAPVFATVNLLIGLVWAVGTAAIFVGQLNIMTMMMAVILLGLGIDFSIHLISGFTEWRAMGDSIEEAMKKTFLKSGKGIITGALTTACAFLTLVISHSQGMKEMGLVTGTGLLSILLATMAFLPALMVLRERRLDRKRGQETSRGGFLPSDLSFRFLGKSSLWLSRRPTISILISLIGTLILIWFALQITFDHNYMNIEPKGLTSIVLQDTVLDKFDLSMDYALIIADDVDQSRLLSEEYRELGSVALTEDISSYLPSPEQQMKREPHILEVRDRMLSVSIKESMKSAEIPALIKEINRLEMNVMELQDIAYLGGQDKIDDKCKEIVGLPDNPDSKNILADLLLLLEDSGPSVAEKLSALQQIFAPYFKETVLRMSSSEPIRFDELPDSVLDRYSNGSRNQFLVTVFPAGNIWQDAGFLGKFVADLESVSDRATGMPPVFRALIEIIGRDGRNAVFLTLLIVFLLLWMDFRSPLYALMAMVPLACGIFWMVGLMRVVGMQITVMNVMGLPMIVGIGIDDGVHIIHRWLHEGKGKINLVFASTGKAIFLTSLTTMLAFGSLIFSIWRGFGHLGGALFLGVGTCFLATVLILPGLLGIIEKTRKRKDLSSG
ncbi:MAG: MMPL family transporter [Candidatus Aminicenantes bacterium]|nr:MMPL family transporter [Candidatus Aminicenantes bacterium]